MAVDQSSEARYNFSLADNLHQVVVSLGYKLQEGPVRGGHPVRSQTVDLLLPGQLHPDSIPT